MPNVITGCPFDSVEETLLRTKILQIPTAAKTYVKTFLYYDKLYGATTITDGADSAVCDGSAMEGITVWIGRTPSSTMRPLVQSVEFIVEKTELFGRAQREDQFVEVDIQPKLSMCATKKVN